MSIISGIPGVNVNVRKTLYSDEEIATWAASKIPEGTTEGEPILIIANLVEERLYRSGQCPERADALKTRFYFGLLGAQPFVECKDFQLSFNVSRHMESVNFLGEMVDKPIKFFTIGGSNDYPLAKIDLDKPMSVQQKATFVSDYCSWETRNRVFAMDIYPFEIKVGTKAIEEYCAFIGNTLMRYYIMFWRSFGLTNQLPSEFISCDLALREEYARKIYEAYQEYSGSNNVSQRMKTQSKLRVLITDARKLGMFDIKHCLALNTPGSLVDVPMLVRGVDEILNK